MPSKNRERLFFQELCALRPDLGLTEAEQRESPDFIALSGERRVGVEITSFSPSVEDGHSPYEAQNSLRNRTVQLAQTAYDSAGGVPLHVQVLFNYHRPLAKARVPELASEIAAFLLPQTQFLSEFATLPFTPFDKAGTMEEISHLGATRVPSAGYGEWYAGKSGWVRQADHQDLIRTLSGKERRVASYRRSCDQLWLLVVFDFLGGSIHTDGPEEPVTFSLTTGFDRVLCLDHSRSRCIDIPITAARSDA